MAKIFQVMYKRVVLVDGAGASLTSAYFSKNIRKGYNFHIIGLIYSIPMVTAQTDISPDLTAEILFGSGQSRIQNEPMVFDLIGTPGKCDRPSLPAHGARPGRDIGFKRFFPLDYIVSDHDSIMVKIKGMSSGDPDYIDMAFIGVLTNDN